MKKKYYIKPSLDAYLVSKEKGEVEPYYTKVIGEKISYTSHNYLKPWIYSALKIRHFEAALYLTKEYFHKCNVIDFGCADGVFLPSLAKYFNKVTKDIYTKLLLVSGSHRYASTESVNIY